MSALKFHVLNHDPAPNSFLEEMIQWARRAPADIFAPNLEADIYGKVRAELGPWRGEPGSAERDIHRRAVMLTVMLVLAMFESDCDWREGVDTSRLGENTSENAEAGAWQVSYDARGIAKELQILLATKGICDGIGFQRAMKFDHPLAMEFVARLLRHSTHHNGPLFKGGERDAIRRSLRGEEHSIYPYLKKETVEEFFTRLS